MDHPSNTKRGYVCLYYKFLLPLRVIHVSYLQECINLRLKLVTKHVVFYRSPSQTKDEFENFIKHLELNVEHIPNKYNNARLIPERYRYSNFRRV